MAQRPYKFQIKVDVGSKDEKLVNLLKTKDSELAGKERLLQAIKAFWLPIALRQAGSSQEEITRYGLASILRLQEQIAYLALELDLQIPMPCCISNNSSNNHSIENGANACRARVRSNKSVKNYTEIDGLEEQVYQSDEDFEQNNHPNQLDKAILANNNGFDKIFGQE